MAIKFHRNPTQEEFCHMAKFIRPADVMEIWQACGLTPTHAIAMLEKASDVVFVALHGKQPVYLFGGLKGAPLAACGQCWGFATTWCDKHPLTLAKVSKTGFRMIFDELPVPRLSCRILADGEATKTWIKWLGAKLDEKTEPGVNGGNFQRYVIEREACYGY